MTNFYLEWIFFNLFVIIVLGFDLIWSKGKVYNFKSSIIWVLIWTGLALLVNLWFFIFKGTTQGVEFLTAYIAERALSFDNLFVFIIIFQYFKIPAQIQPLTLTYGILGALIARAVFIAAGISLINLFSWIIIIMGVFLIYTGIKIAFIKEDDIDPQKNLVLRISKKFFRISEEYKGTKFIFKDNKGQTIMTPLMLIVLVLASTDVVFAVDSIPTVLGITTNSFIVWSSNMMAVIGMRPLYFLIYEMKNYFRYLKHGLSLILVFIGMKMVLGHGIEISDFSFNYHIDTLTSLAVIIGVVLLSIIVSIIIPGKHGTNS